MKLKVYRYNETMNFPRYDTFEIDSKPGMTVLSALFQFQERYDDSLAFRYSCRGAVCGNCAMLINKVPRLACRTQVASLLNGELKINLSHYPALEETVNWNPEEEVLVEPLPHLPIIKDLMVDMDAFFSTYKFVEPILKPERPAPQKERLMDLESVHELETFTNCILCGACFGSCPVDGENTEYLGPAALAKLYRFHIDPRDSENSGRLKRADIAEGWWACKFHANCKRVCPKDVPPITAIAKAREELLKKNSSEG